MAVDRNAIVTLHEKGESNSVIAKKLQIRRETVWNVVKNFKETAETCNRPVQGRKRSVRTKQLVKKHQGEVEKPSSLSCKIGCRSRSQSDINA
jgi:transposase